MRIFLITVIAVFLFLLVVNRFLQGFKRFCILTGGHARIALNQASLEYIPHLTEFQMMILLYKVTASQVCDLFLNLIRRNDFLLVDAGYHI